MNRRVSKWIAAATVVTGVSAVTIVAAPSASALDDGFYSVPYADTLWYHLHGVRERPVSHEEWGEFGFPAPSPVPTDFVKLPWFDAIYAVSYFDEQSWQWHWLSPVEWARAGYPTPRIVDWIQGMEIVAWATTPREIFVRLPGEPAHKLTYAEWLALGKLQPGRLEQGFLKLSWSSGIALMDDIAAGPGRHIAYAEWRQHGFPTPELRAMLPGDYVCATPGTAQLTYVGVSFNSPITYDQWRAAGFPAPRSC